MARGPFRAFDSWLDNVEHWSDAAEEGRAILLAIVSGETPPDLPAAEERLRNQDLLNSDGQFAVPMIERWVREKASKLFSRAM